MRAYATTAVRSIPDQPIAQISHKVLHGNMVFEICRELNQMSPEVLSAYQPSPRPLRHLQWLLDDDNEGKKAFMESLMKGVDADFPTKQYQTVVVEDEEGHRWERQRELPIK